MRITKLIARRVIVGALTLFLVSTVVFAATQALPGNAARAMLGQQATPERIAALERRLKLNEPVVTQYTQWLGHVVVGNFGTSMASGRPVTETLGERIDNSLFLAFVAAIVAIPMSIGIGVLGAIRRDKPIDHVISAGTLVLTALPEFVIGILLALVFATQLLHVLPAVSLIPSAQHAWDQPSVVVLPAATLVVAVMPYISRIMRGSMVDVLESDYVTMARLKGLTNRTVIWRHAVPNAIVPAIQVSALSLAYMAGGVVIVEAVFSYPGIGQALVDGVANRDIPLVQALALMISAVYVILNLLADLLTLAVTPRLRTAGR